MRISTFAGILVSLLLITQTTFGAVSIFFFKAYSDDFKKHKTNQFMAGDPIYGLINVSAIAINDNNVTSLDQFADANGGVMIRIYFPDLDKEIIWKMTLASGRVKNNRFLFCVMPESPDKLDKDYFAVLKVLNQQKGNKVKMTVRTGEKDVTAWWEDDITIDLTNGLGTYGDWYNQLTPASLKSANVYYWACESKSQPYVDFRRDEIKVKTFTADSIEFTCNGTPHTATRVEGYNFLVGKERYNSFVVKRVDENSFIIYSIGDFSGTWSYYHLNNDLKNEQDLGKRCPTSAIGNLTEELKPYFDAQAAVNKQEQEVKQKQDKIALTKYVQAFVSKRNDPELEKQIIQWWNTRYPGQLAVKVKFIDPDFFLVRDEYNQVLRRLIGAFVLYKNKSGGCTMQWDAFGYEHLGGGAFVKDLTAWVAGYKEFSNYQYKAAGMSLVAGGFYDFDCSGLK